MAVEFLHRYIFIVMAVLFYLFTLSKSLFFFVVRLAYCKIFRVATHPVVTNLTSILGFFRSRYLTTSNVLSLTLSHHQTVNQTGGWQN